MSGSDTELDRLLALWAAQHRLSEHEVVQLRARVLEAGGADVAEALDQDWFWRLLRPLTSLLDQFDDEATPRAPGRANAWGTYLQLA
ncbi:MAG: hypothetical protein JO020_00675 [Chloroflexi bacterium]|nr:hypothetical protein [Chloroflexota bacterium]MBV9892664.1 hypothetical protein [Chloroflexota bacterium]